MISGVDGIAVAIFIVFASKEKAVKLSPIVKEFQDYMKTSLTSIKLMVRALSLWNLPGFMLQKIVNWLSKSGSYSIVNRGILEKIFQSITTRFFTFFMSFF